MSQLGTLRRTIASHLAAQSMSRLPDSLVRLLATVVMALASLGSATRPAYARQLPALTVHVVDVQALPVPGATCSLVRTVGNTAPATVVSDERGDAVFGGVGAGTYTL